MSENTATQAGERNQRKVREGLVVSDKMDKTIVVAVEDRVKHALYGKVMRKTSRLKAHDSGDPVGGACDVMRHAFLRWTMRALPTCVCSLAYARRREGAVASAAREHNQLSAVERP